MVSFASGGNAGHYVAAIGRTWRLSGDVRVGSTETRQAAPARRTRSQRGQGTVHPGTRAGRGDQGIPGFRYPEVARYGGISSWRSFLITGVFLSPAISRPAGFRKSADVGRYQSDQQPRPRQQNDLRITDRGTRLNRIAPGWCRLP